MFKGPLNNVLAAKVAIEGFHIELNMYKMLIYMQYAWVFAYVNAYIDTYNLPLHR